MADAAGQIHRADLFIATVAAYEEGNGTYLYLPGSTTPTQKPYKKLAALPVADGNRVLVARVSGSYVVIGKIDV